MILLTNGDSWTQGDSPAQTLNWEAKKTLDWYDIVPFFGNFYTHSSYGKIDPQESTRVLYKFYDSNVWPKVLGRKLGVETWNAGRLGDSNHDIANTTIQSCEWLRNQGKKDIFAVIGWTSKIRVPIYTVSEDGSEVSIKQQRPDNYEAANEVYRRFNYIQNEFLQYVLYLQNYFKVNNIDYLMFNAFDPFEDFNVHFLSNAIDKTKWINNTVSPAHFKEYIFQKRNLKNWEESPYFITCHPRDNAHIDWGNYLYNYIQSL